MRHLYQMTIVVWLYKFIEIYHEWWTLRKEISRKKNRPNLSGWKLQPFSSSRRRGAAADFDRLSEQRKNSVISTTTGAGIPCLWRRFLVWSRVPGPAVDVDESRGFCWKSWWIKEDKPRVRKLTLQFVNMTNDSEWKISNWSYMNTPTRFGKEMQVDWNNTNGWFWMES